MARYAILLSLVAVAALPAAADTLTLGSGRQVKGKVVKETNDALFVDVGYTIIEVPKKQILKRSADEDAGKAKSGAQVKKGDLFSTIEREEMSVKDNVERTAAAVVMVSTPGGLGSGFIITPDGYVVTNDHVVQGETKITITLFEKGKDGRIAKRKVEKVKIVAINAYVDLALLKMEDQKDLPIVYLGDSDKIRMGQSVYAVGNPLGLERSVSEGIVSTLNRPFEGLVYIQTTTQINPGNSGGPLFNLKGEVIGVTNMGYMFSEGLNFAIPASALKQFLKNRDAFAYDKDNPNSGYRYLPAPRKPGTGKQ
jgi:serine protease Do